MICSHCGQSYPDDEVPKRCAVCDNLLEGTATQTPTDEVLPSDFTDKPHLEEPMVLARSAQEIAAERDASRRRELELVELERSEKKKMEWNHWVSEPIESAPAQPVRPGVGPVQVVEATGSPEDDKPLDPKLLTTISSLDENENFITVIGYGGSGKTFFVNRLRNDLARSWRRKPGPAEEILISPAGIELTRFAPRQGGAPCFVLDCAGESFATALRAQGDTEELTQGTVRTYLAALCRAHAFVLVIKAEDLVTFSRSNRSEEPAVQENRKFIRKMLTEFDDIIHAILITKSRLQKGEALESILRRGISRVELEEEFKKARRCSQPLYVAFSLADRLANLRGETYDMDPFLFALETAPVFFHTINESFDYYRFDFLTAFQGHGDRNEDEDSAVVGPGEGEKQNFRPNYQRASYGATEAFNWIHQTISSNRPQPARRSRQGELPTRELVRLRQKTDPVFGAAWRGR